MCLYFLYFIHFIFVSFRLKYRNACIKSFIRTYRLVQTMFFHFLTSKRFWHPHARCVRLWMCVCVIFFSLVSFRRTNNVAIFWSIWHNFSAENTISFDRWSIYSNANCMQKKTHWLGKQHAYTYAYTWWFIFMFVPIFYSFFVGVLFFAIHNHLCISFELISLSIPSVRIYIIAIYFWFIFHTHVNQQTKNDFLIFS